MAVAGLGIDALVVFGLVGVSPVAVEPADGVETVMPNPWS